MRVGLGIFDAGDEQRRAREGPREVEEERDASPLPDVDRLAAPGRAERFLQRRVRRAARRSGERLAGRAARDLQLRAPWGVRLQVADERILGGLRVLTGRHESAFRSAARKSTRCAEPDSSSPSMKSATLQGGRPPYARRAARWAAMPALSSATPRP